MSREIRRVPKDWKHPKKDGIDKPLFYSGHHGDLAKKIAKWDEEEAQWKRGFRSDWDHPGKWILHEKTYDFKEWDGDRPDPADYMPDWLDAERTHLQMYETTTEGTPISPVFETPEKLARWLANNEASTFAGMTTSYENWLRMIGHGHSIGSMMTGGPEGPVSGVDVAAGVLKGHK